LQAFQLTTGELLNAMVRNPDNRIGKLIAAGKSDADELTSSTWRRCAGGRANRNGRSCWLCCPPRRTAGPRGEDVVWAVVKRKEFLLRR